jgi:asparagine synthetase B (glutamine-hydrolysing)
MVNYYEVKGIKQPVTFEEIYDFIEGSMLSKADMTSITEVINEFSNCQALKRKTEDLAEVNEELKKKITDGMRPESQPTQQD